jgi:starch-binding outer membrane protein, SusD/RagB family
MKKSRLFSGLVLITILAVVSCQEDFLDVAPQNSLNQATLGNESGVNAALISAYSMLDGWDGDWGNGPWGGQGSNWLYGDIVSDDAYKGTEPTDGPEWEAIENFIWTPLDNELNIKFRTDYQAISRANATIRLAQGTSGLDADFTKRIIAEAKVLRAHYHFDLYKIFKFIPYYKETDFDYKKSNVDGSGNYIDPIDDIIADLTDAVPDLPTTQLEKGRITKGTAQAYLGKALLYNKQYTEAKAAFDAVVTSGVFSLQDNYHNIFATIGENGEGGKRESLLSFQASVQDGVDDGQNANFSDRLTFPHAGSPFGCCGFRQPSQNLVNAYRVDANGLPLFTTYNDVSLTSPASAADVVDPRLDWTVQRLGVPVLNWSDDYSLTWVRAPAYAGEFSNKKKLYHQDAGESSGTSWVPTQLSSVNIHFIRYADVLLMLAECEVELGNLNTAMGYVNQVRTRAAKFAQGPKQSNANNIGLALGAPGTSTVTAWATYKVGLYSSFPDATYARRAVQWERRLELAIEGTRFFDLRRWGIAKQVMNDYIEVERTRRSHIEKAKVNGGYQDKHDLFPLPQLQLDLSSINNVPQLKQNEAWQ